ncbi:amidohydrolase [soil metagenome]
MRRMSDRTHLLLNAAVHAIDDRRTRAEAIAWRDGRVLAVGPSAVVAEAAGPEAIAIDLQGRTVLPGFIDPHHHPCIVALYGGALRLTAPAVTDITSLQRTLAERAEITPKGEWIVATEWDEHLLREQRPPTRSELDDAVPDHPLFALHYTCHRGAANSRALDEAGIGKDSPDPSGGEIVRGRDRIPTGILLERAMSPVERRARASLVARDPEGFLGRLGAHHRALAAAGITRVIDATVPADLVTLYREASRRGLLLVPTVMMPVSTQGYLEAPWEALDGPPTGESAGDLLVIGPVKLVFDGAPGCAMCLGWLQTAGIFLRACAMAVEQGSLDALRTTMSVAPRLGAQIRTGIQIYRREEANTIVRAATDRGFSVATHAIGNEAIAIALDAYEAVGASLSRHGMPRIEHATFLDPGLVARIAGVGAAVVTQPYFVKLPAFASLASIPGVRNAPLRWLLDAKVLVSGSSDYPVAGFEPLAAIAAAVSRTTTRGDVYEADQRISIDEAIALYTRNAAAATDALSQCGTLEVGKRADLVVIDGSVADVDSIAAARVRATVIGGTVAFGSLD